MNRTAGEAGDDGGKRGGCRLSLVRGEDAVSGDDEKAALEQLVAAKGAGGHCVLKQEALGVVRVGASLDVGKPYEAYRQFAAAEGARDERAGAEVPRAQEPLLQVTV
ncbi:hypothetical protein [Krasilnikovia sp. M28-CT-15]|uniref:hypothetical protein n=1 Tax=Krasilnikovia sp. M28-CT-15 TaxID=3373540 RepID=UPI0038777D61